jgi:hypothetical protein
MAKTKAKAPAVYFCPKCGKVFDEKLTPFTIEFICYCTAPKGTVVKVREPKGRK